MSFDHLVSDFKNIELLSSPIRKIAGDLAPEESRFVQNFGDVRKDEFRAGRILARKALTELGIEDFPLLADEHRYPIWPEGITGSISHTLDFCMVAVAKAQTCQGIGVDLEIISRVKEQLWPRVCTEKELSWIESHAPSEHNNLAALIFSAKEAFYKCQYPLTHQFFNFKDVEISLQDDSKRFEIHLANPANFVLDEERFESQYIFQGKYIATLCLYVSQI